MRSRQLISNTNQAANRRVWTHHPRIHNLTKIHLESSMMTSSNGNIFRVTGPLCGEFTGPGEFPTQRPVTRSFDVFFDLRLNMRLSKQPWSWWFETLSWSLWRHCNAPSVVKLPSGPSMDPPRACSPILLGLEVVYTIKNLNLNL